MNKSGFMLVHGGGHDARCWDRLTPHLEATALAIDLPGRGARPADLTALRLSDLVDSAVSDLDAFDDAERVVLVGHSMAGITIPAVAARRPNRIAQLVFVSCGIPREGGSLSGELPLWIQLLRTWLSQNDPEKGRKPMRPWLAKYMFGNDMDADQTAFLLSRLVPEATGFLTEAVSRKELPAADVLPRTYVKLLRDHALRPKLQDRFITHLGGCRVRTLDSGHDAMISHPKELAAILNLVAINGHPGVPGSQ